MLVQVDLVLAEVAEVVLASWALGLMVLMHQEEHQAMAVLADLVAVVAVAVLPLSLAVAEVAFM